VGSCVYRTTTAIYSLGTGCVHLSRSAYRSTQPSTFRGMVNEYQLSG